MRYGLKDEGTAWRSSCRALVLGLALFLLAGSGCETLPHWSKKKDEPPVGIPCRVVTTWQPQIAYAPDTTRGGQPTPGLLGRVYLFGQEIGTPMVSDGQFVAFLLEPGANPGEQPVTREVWHIDSKTLQRFIKKDMIGWGYSLFLPYPAYNPDDTNFLLRVCFLKPDGSPVYQEKDTNLSLRPDNGMVRTTHHSTPVGPNPNHPTTPPGPAPAPAPAPAPGGQGAPNDPALLPYPQPLPEGERPGTGTSQPVMPPGAAVPRRAPGLHPVPPVQGQPIQQSSSPRPGWGQPLPARGPLPGGRGAQANPAVSPLQGQQIPQPSATRPGWGQPAANVGMLSGRRGAQANPAVSPLQGQPTPPPSATRPGWGRPAANVGTLQPWDGRSGMIRTVAGTR
jgi:hypothetical protein